MTESIHSYRAYLVGTPDVELAVRGGGVTLDVTRAPHVTGSLEIAVPSLAVLTALDPRTTKRIRIEVSAVMPSGVQSRTFNLGLRARRMTHGRDPFVTLDVASDEAILSDYSPLADGDGAFAFQSSIRAIVNYALNKAIPGAALAAAPSGDAPMRALISSDNVVRNPRAGLNLTDWSSPNGMSRQAAGGPTGSPTYVALQAGAGGAALSVSIADAGVPVQAGRVYRLSAWVFCSAAGVGIDALVKDAAGTVLLDVAESPIGPTAGWTRIAVEFTAPANAVKATLRAFTTSTVPASQYCNITGWRLSEKTIDYTDVGYFDGDTAATTEYAYAWTGAAHASTSRRTALISRAADLLLWKTGQSALDFVVPIVQAAGFRLVNDESRTWTLRPEVFTAPGSLTIRNAINLESGADTISRDSSTWCDACVTVYTWLDQNNVQRTAVDAFALTTPYTKLLRIEKTTPYPGPGFSAYVVRRAQGRGREVSATSVADWTARAEQPVDIGLEGAPTLLGQTSTVAFDIDTDSMTITARTTDTPAGAIDLLAGTIDALVGTIDGL